MLSRLFTSKRQNRKEKKRKKNIYYGFIESIHLGTLPHTKCPIKASSLSKELTIGISDDRYREY
jgi:hypothetical protein